MTRAPHTPARDILGSLLRRNVSAGQLAGYALANFAGLAIVMCALMLWADVRSAWDGGAEADRDYMILSKKVEGLGGFGGQAAAFTPEERADIESRPWAAKVGEFTPARFGVWAQLAMGGRSMGSALFLESVPDSFLDVTPPGWDWHEGQKELPVIISKDYLALYNFGFAASRGLPQLSESMIGMVPVRLALSGPAGPEWVDARIVGFSSRLNTIAVPESFMRWANERYATEPPSAPSRLIVQLRRPADPEAEAYAEAHGYDTAGDKASLSRASTLLTAVTGAVVGVGVVIVALAFFILLLSVWLLLQKDRSRIRTLMLLGYSPAQVARPYRRMVGVVNAAVFVLSAGAMIAASAAWRSPLASLGAEGGSPWGAIAAGAGITLIVTLANFYAIRARITRYYRQ